MYELTRTHTHPTLFLCSTFRLFVILSILIPSSLFLNLIRVPLQQLFVHMKASCHISFLNFTIHDHYSASCVAWICVCLCVLHVHALLPCKR
uniref:Uncharacterized protein n=1 Tax=Gasterosteus aculeatus TaxID=69293 RepID=G3Q0M8_GASAC